METPITSFDESLVVALCKSIYDGKAVIGSGYFKDFVMPKNHDQLRTALSAIKSLSGRTFNSWKEVEAALGPAYSGTQNFVVVYLRFHDELVLAVRELTGHPIPDFKEYMRRIISGASQSFDRSVHTDAIAIEFDAHMRESIIEAGRVANRLIAKNIPVITGTLEALEPYLHNPNPTVISKVMQMLEIVLTNVLAARDGFLGCQMPSGTLLSILSHISVGHTITSATPIHYYGQIGITMSEPKYLSMPDANPNTIVQELISANKGLLSNSIVSPIVAARIWTFYKTLKQEHLPASSPMAGGAMKKSKKTRRIEEMPVLGGAAKDASTARIDINNRFGERIVRLVQNLANTIDDLVKNPSTELVGFLADATSRPLIAAFMEVKFPTNSYIPILSGYYRVVEAEARRKRYVATLASLVESIEKIATGPSSSLDGASRNSFGKCKAIVKEMISAIDESNREMDAVFAKLATGQISEVVAADTLLSNGREEVSTIEAGGQTGDEHLHLTKALERLREAAHAAPTKKSIITGLDKIEEYMKKGKSICEDAIKSRIDDLTLSYQGVLSHIDPTVKSLAKKVVDFKLESTKDFYKTLLETEAYLSKAHKSFLASPSVRDELYRAISGWTLAAQKSSTIDERFRREVENILGQIFSSDELAVFSYYGDTLVARRLGYGKITAGAANVAAVAPFPAIAPVAPIVGDETVANRAEEDNTMYDKFRRALMQSLNYCPQLHLVFNLVNIIEKTFGRELDTKKLYESAVRFIIASSVDVCTRAEAMAPYSPHDLVKNKFHLVGRYDNAHLVQADAASDTYFVTGAAAAAGADGCAAPPTESTCMVHTDAIGIYFRHAFAQLRFEDDMFVRWLKSICANLLLALDRDRATHGVEKINLPGAERLLIGGALDDPIGITGSTRVIPEVVPLYIAFPTACRAYEAYFTWEGSEGKLKWKKTDEPRLIVEVPRSSPYFTILETVRSHKTVETLSETYIAQLVAATNTIWGHFASIPDPDKRKTAILDSFFDEINNTLLMRMSSEQDEASAQREMDRDKDAISGVEPGEDKLTALPQSKEDRQSLRRRIFTALKGISMSVYDIMSRVGTSEENMANDYKAYVERLQKRIADVPDQERFRELVRAMQTPDDTVGDIQGLFMSFVEFVIAPLFLIASITENFVYRSVNLYMQILRVLFSVRYVPDQVAGDANAAAGVGALVAAHAPAANAILARHWLTYGGAADMYGAADHNASHAQRVAHVLANMETRNFHHALQAANDHNARDSRDAFAGTAAAPVGSTKYFLHMYQPIYKALELLLDAGGEYLDFNVVSVDDTAAPTPARVGKIAPNRFYALIDDSVSDLKAALAVFMKIGKRESADTYFRDITTWEPKSMLKDVTDATNAALKVVHCDFYVPREYLPAAVCYDEVAAVGAAPAAGSGWVVNFLRNTFNSEQPNFASELIAYHESIQMIIGSPTRWTFIARRMVDRVDAVAAVVGPPAVAQVNAVAGTANPESARNWTVLGAKHGIFSPIIKSGNKVGPGTGLMPWTEEDSQVIEGGWISDPKDGYIQVGAGLNTPVLYSPADHLGVAHLGNTHQVLNLGGTVRGTRNDIANAAAANSDASLGTWCHTAAGVEPGVAAYHTGNVIQSLLYAHPSHGTKAETFNRLLAKMASCLALQGEQPCVLYDLANDMVSHPGLSTYFQTVDVTIPGTNPGDSQTFTCFPEAIGTPVRVNTNWHMLYDGTKIWNVRPDGTAPPAAQANHPVIPSPAAPVAPNDGLNASAYKPGSFLYDAVLTPFHNSAHGKATRRIAELSNAEMAKYLAAIPQFLTAYKALLRQVASDIDMGASSATQADHPTGRFQGIDNHGGAAGAWLNQVHDIAAPPADILTIPSKMKLALMAVIECLARTYRAIREKYGASVHVEMVKGDFDPYLTGGKFDTMKLATPMSLIAGMGLVDKDGPVVFANFCERGSRHTDTALALAWASAVGHREIAGSDTIPLESVPWTVALAERMKKMTHASLDTVLQPIVTRIARLGFIQNSMNLTALACHNPWGCHSVPSAIFHPHIIELHVASMRAGFDLFRGIDHANVHVDALANHFMAESSLPWLADVHATYLSLAEPLCNANVLNGAAGSLGPWITPPFPITYDVTAGVAAAAAGAAPAPAPAPAINQVLASQFCYTANPFVVSSGSQDVTLNLGPVGAPVVRTAGAPRHAIADANVLALHITGRRDIGNNYFDNAHVAAGTPSGILIAGILQQMEKNPYEQAWLKDDRPKRHFLGRMQAYGPKVEDGVEKRIEQWNSSKTKPKGLMAKQLGFKLRDGDYDGSYIEMVRFSPPKERWSDELSAEERHMTGLFMYLKRNPISILSTLRLIPFASIYSFSEAFDLYFQLAASRTAKTRGSDKVRAYVPSLITEPLSLARRYTNLSDKERESDTWLLADTDAWKDPAAPNVSATAQYGVRERARVQKLAGLGEGAADLDARAYQSIRPHPSATSIPKFYEVRKTVNGQAVGLCSPSNDAVVQNRALTAFPLFALYVRMLDQYGIVLKEELATRLGEIRYDKPESLAQFQNALINVLGAST
jgi:hypothetical protein